MWIFCVDVHAYHVPAINARHIIDLDHDRIACLSMFSKVRVYVFFSLIRPNGATN